MTRTDDLMWQRWDEVDSLLDRALDLPAEERPAHVASQAARDPALRDLVLRLLEQLDAGGDRVTCPADAVVLGAFSGGESFPADDLEPGTMVGRYVVRGRRGRGGMATVYEADRADGIYRQRVALKVLRRGLDTEDLIRRFLTERQILSSLTHPSIAQLLDGGSLPDGRPFLVMELVDGKPITGHADDARLDLRARLDLFLHVAGAVSSAHRQLVVHRDIKPSNILVDGEGRVKLLDFGIAKLLADENEQTQAGARALTPDYASPEQIRGEVITTGTDVYQLGLLLRELLTGLRPLAGDTRPGEPPVRPSRGATLTLPGAPEPAERARTRGTTPEKLARTLSGELDIIVAKALRPEPRERYGSVEALADDVRRYLRGRPIMAHPESAAYRLRKFATRHPLVLPGVAAATLALGAFITTLTLQNRRITRERDAAEAATRRAVATQEFLVGFLRAPDPTGQAPARDITVAEALQRGRSRADSALRDQPDVRAAVVEAIGLSYLGLGRTDEADTLLSQAVGLYRALYGPDDPRVAPAVGALGDMYRRVRNYKAADSAYHESLRLRTREGRADTSIAVLLGAMSSTRRDLGDIDSAVALAARAVALHQSTGDTTSAGFLSVLTSLGYTLRGANRLDSAEAVYRRVLLEQQRHPEVGPYALSLTHNNLGYLLRLKKDFDGAEQAYRESARLVAEAMGDAHPNTIMVRNNLAAVLELAGKYEQVEAIGQEQIAAAERGWPDGHWRVGSAYMAQGRFLLRRGRPADAIPPLEAGVRTYTATIGATHIWTAVAQLYLGTAQLMSGQKSRGTATLTRAHAVLAKASNLDQDSRDFTGRLATYLTENGQPDWANRIRQLLPQG